MKTAASKSSNEWPKLGRSAVSGQFVLAPAKRPSAAKAAKIRDVVRSVLAERRG
jgi:hypothetical protein